MENMKTTKMHVLLWEDIEYTEVTVKKNVPEESGIYILLVSYENTTWRRLYVGQADNLKIRLLQHLSDSEKNNEIKTCVFKFRCIAIFATVRNQADRDSIEKFLYDEYKRRGELRGNKISPPKENVEPIEVNIPEHTLIHLCVPSLS